MTTDRRPAAARSSPVRDVRAAVVAALALVYVAAWWAFAAPARRSTTAATAPAPAPPARPDPPSAAWYEDVPPSLRPVVAVPSGWQLAPAGTPRPGIEVRALAPPRAAPAPVPRRRAGRLRTRSS